MKFLGLLVLVTLAVGCSKDDGRMKERAAVEGESTSQSQMRVENANLAAKAEQMEKDLARRHRFYQALKGVYEGVINTDIGDFNIRMTFTPSMAPMQYNRVRQLEEIASDLNNLTINAQILQWDSSNVATAIGCRVSDVRPDLEKGTLAISTENCPNLYRISVTERSQTGTQSETAYTAQRVSNDVLRGDLFEIDSIVGTVQPSTNAAIFKFVAQKVE